MKYFVIGASGLVGGNFVKHLKEEGNEVVGTHVSLETPDTVFFDAINLDNENNFDLDSYAPDVIVHCAALAHVDYCEDHIEESFEKTVQSSLNVIELCKKHNATMVFTSTDYVFDGKNGPYIETDEVNPLSVYGKHKLEVEKTIQKELPNSGVILRIGHVYGDEIRGKNFISRIINNVKEGLEWEMSIPYDQYATPVWAYDVARVGVLLANDNKSGVYHVGSTDFVNRIQLTNKVLNYLPDHKCKLNAVTTESLNAAAERPLMSGHISKRLLAEYPDFEFHNIDYYLNSKGLKRN